MAEMPHDEHTLAEQMGGVIPKLFVIGLTEQNSTIALAANCARTLGKRRGHERVAISAIAVRGLSFFFAQEFMRADARNESFGSLYFDSPELSAKQHFVEGHPIEIDEKRIPLTFQDRRMKNLVLVRTIAEKSDALIVFGEDPILESVILESVMRGKTVFFGGKGTSWEKLSECVAAKTPADKANRACRFSGETDLSELISSEVRIQKMKIRMNPLRGH